MVRSILVGSVLLGVLSQASLSFGQAFTPQPLVSVNNLPVAPGFLTPQGGTTTAYFTGMNRFATVVAGSHVGFDALAFFPALNSDGSVASPPPGWAWWYGDARQGIGINNLPCDCYGQISVYNLVPVRIAFSYWGNGANGWRPYYLQAAHIKNGANPPVLLPDPPVKFKQPGDGHSCAADPCDTKTGLYYQQDTDIEVPDVIPITLTRTYRTEDTASRVFGIGASHPYD